jgi:microcystin-dependent protein
MANCSNCYNGCAEIVSDKCVRYTGVDVPVLGIQNGDSLSYVEQALITFLTSTLDGTGIKPTIDPAIICNLVDQYLPDCGDLTIVDISVALIKAACDLQEQIDAINATLTTLNADYDVDCLSGVTNSSDTHAVLQAVIDKLCQLEIDLVALELDLTTNYVKLADLNSLIAAYLASVAPSGTQQYTKMVPYTAVEYYGSLSNFDGSGKGLVSAGFDKIYLCNGQNGTPDKRGRLPVGVIQGVPGGAMDPAVDPAFPGNTNYSLLTTNGANTVTLTSAQMPVHTHATTVTLTDPGHKHSLTIGQSYTGAPTSVTTVGSGANGPITLDTTTATTGLTVGVTNANAGSGQSHTNVPPVLACYYIMYIP